MMNLKNPFSMKTREIWIGWYRCLKCGSNQNLELHHITGRDSSSALNSCPLCHACHEQINHSRDTERKLFAKVVRILVAKRYNLKQKDIDFMREHDYLVVDNQYLTSVCETDIIK